MNVLIYEKRDFKAQQNDWDDYLRDLIPEARLLICANEDDFLQSTRHYLPDIAIVSMDGADGMEAAIAIRRQYPKVSLVWFSDDRGFAIQAYRLNTAYFHQKPVTKQIMYKALTGCRPVVTGGK